jgi:hypothetical protein
MEAPVPKYANDSRRYDPNRTEKRPDNIRPGDGEPAHEAKSGRGCRRQNAHVRGVWDHVFGNDLEVEYTDDTDEENGCKGQRDVTSFPAAAFALMMRVSVNCLCVG